MNAHDSEATFRARLDTAGIALGAATANRLFEAALAFYAEGPASDVDALSDGDMLLFQWSTTDYGGSRALTLDITRQFISIEQADDDDIWQLSCHVGYVGDDLPLDFGTGSRWCSSIEDLPAFREFLSTHPMLSALGDRTARATITYACCG